VKPPLPAAVYDDGSSSTTARTHVLIVAVGRYPAFQGGGKGSDPIAPLKQLASPPASAYALANWFIDEYNYDPAPLGSVTLLISGPGVSEFVRSNGKRFDVGTPTYARFEKVAQAWSMRGRNPGSRLIFVFCGHGYGYGGESSLLMSDFDFRKPNCWDFALHLGNFVAGMEEVPAAEQIYFIDACRTPHPAHLAPNATIGRSPVQVRTASPREGLPKRNAPIFFSTGDAEPARARKNDISVQGFKGA